MIKNLLTFFLLIVTSVSFCACAKQEKNLTITKGILSVGLEMGYPPMEYYDTDGVTPIGFDIELTKALGEKLGLKVNYIDTAWEGILAGLDAGRYDIAVNITILPERQQRYNFTNPYINTSMTITALKKSRIKIEKPEDIAGKRVAYQGDTTAQFFTERLRDQNIMFTSFAYDKIINCFDDLALRRVDVIAADNIVASEYTKNENSIYEIIWQGQPDEYIAIALKKGNDTLTAALNSALGELFAENKMREISLRIFNRDVY